MSSLAEILGQEIRIVVVDDDGSVTVTHDGIFASLRTIEIADGLTMVWLIQMLGEDLPLTDDLRHRVAAQASKTMFGTVTLTEQPKNRANVILRYIFPADGLDARALQTLVLMVLDAGAEARQALTPSR